MEVVVAVVLLGVLATLVVSIVLQAQAKTVGNRARIAASNLAAREIDLVREQFMATENGPTLVADAGTVVNGNSITAPGAASHVDGTAYTVTRSSAWNITGTGGSACEGGSLVEFPTLTVRVEVTWPNMGQIRPVVSTTQLAPSKEFKLASSAAYVAVKVTDATGGPSTGRTVWVGSRPYAGASGRTDATGCALVTVSPSASGTDYVASLNESGFVDVNSDPAPVRNVGRVMRGTLNTAISIAYDRSASLDLRLSGGGATDADVAGQSVVVYRGGGFTGSTPETTYPVTGLRTLVHGLWPGEFAAYFGGTTPPSLTMYPAGPGQTTTIPVDIRLGTIDVSGAPAGARIYAVPQGVTSCAAPGVREVVGGSIDVLPGTWRLFAEDDAFGCSPGPENISAVADGVAAVTWGRSTVSVTRAPAGYGDKIWAVSAAGADATCRRPSTPTDAVLLGSVPGATGELLAGDWYVFVTSGSGGAPDPDARCASAGLVRVAYGADTTVRWPAAVPGPGGRP